jgi:hypothetical protein
MNPCEKHSLEKPKDNKKNEPLVSLVMSCDSQGTIFVISRYGVLFPALCSIHCKGLHAKMACEPLFCVKMPFLAYLEHGGESGIFHLLGVKA